MMNYTQGETPEAAHAAWKRDWKPPTKIPFAMKGRAVVEFGPYATKGSIWQPEKPSYSAMMIDDSGDEVPIGTEVAVSGMHHTGFIHEGRELHIIDRGDILLMEVAEVAG